MVEVREWPTLDGSIPPFANRAFYSIIRRVSAIRQKYPKLNGLGFSLTNWLYRQVYRRLIVKQSVHFLSPYKQVYTTRLHGLILSVLLGKKVYFLDNNYKKLSAFYDTWLTDCEGVERVLS
jgi:pyruvyl transferase EpsO